ncbi:MAG: hypothetical protein MI810_12790, partial [Flavobacteriales bacterium]|nr:hypothetical protein [Flavobacteriales bacterium]
MINTGNITLQNIEITSALPQPQTPVFSIRTLAPGQSMNFQGTLNVPADCCEIENTVTAKGTSLCSSVEVQDQATSICPVLFQPGLEITKTCAPTPVKPGEMMYYEGEIKNTGNITMVQVMVWSNIPGRETPFLGPVALAPGEVLPYAGMFEVPVDFCGTDTVTVEGFSLCGNRRVEASDVSSCPVELSPKLVVRNHCATSPIRHGQQANFSGSVSNVGDSVLHGVTIRNQMVVANHPEQTDTPVTGPMDIAPGETIVFDYTLMIPDDRNCCEIIHSLIASGTHPCDDSLIQSTSTVVCPIETHPSLSVVLDCVTTPHTVGDWVTYHGWIENNGDISLEAL